MGLQSVFGAGYLWGTLAGGTPRLFSALQDITVDFSRDLKALHGQKAYAIEQAPGKAKIECKASIGRFDPQIFNDMYFGGTKTTGITTASNLEAATIPTTPFQVTVVQAATWASDLGVYDKNVGKFLTKVASAPATGQYSVAAGVYTFAAADVGHAVQISYTYTLAGASAGFSIASGNPDMGTTVIFRADLFNTYRGIPSGITLYACQSSKLSMPLKLDDFLMPQIDFSAQDDGLGNVVGLYGAGGFVS